MDDPSMEEQNTLHLPPLYFLSDANVRKLLRAGSELEKQNIEWKERIHFRKIYLTKAIYYILHFGFADFSCSSCLPCA
jgi:hypothetical protein